MKHDASVAYWKLEIRLAFFSCCAGVLRCSFSLGILFVLPAVAFAGCIWNCRAAGEVPQGHYVLKKQDQETTREAKTLPMVERT